LYENSIYLSRTKRGISPQILLFRQLKGEFLLRLFRKRLELAKRSSAIGAKQVKLVSVLVLEHPFSPIEFHRELQRITKKKWLGSELSLEKSRIKN